MPAPSEPDGEWKRMVLRSMPVPAWLLPDAPESDVVLSTRVRFMRNLHGARFPHAAPEAELGWVAGEVARAVDAAGLSLTRYPSLTTAERDHFVGARLLSPDFPWSLPHRVLYVDADQTVSVMVNEEDHLRTQALTGGWSLPNARRIGEDLLERLGRHVEFARTEPRGYLAASPTNTGLGVRYSAMFHLIGLAQSRRLTQSIRALDERGMSVRGLFGESSRAIGAFVQVSLLNGSYADFSGAGEYLIVEERAARRRVGLDRLDGQAARAASFIESQRQIGLADALRSVAWLRWAASERSGGATFGPRAWDLVLIGLDIGAQASIQRSQLLKKALEELISG